VGFIIDTIESSFQKRQVSKSFLRQRQQAAGKRSERDQIDYVGRDDRSVTLLAGLVRLTQVKEPT